MNRVLLDYCFFTEDVVQKETEHEDSTKAKTSLTTLLMVETACHSMWAYAVESKGGGETWVAEQIVEDLETVGISQERLIVKADQENSITDLQREIAKARGPLGTAIEQSKVGDSNTNGKIERAIQDFKGLVRTLRSALEEKLGKKIQLQDPVVPWMIRHAAHLITYCRVRSNGRTAYQLMKGRRSNAKVIPFGETVLFKIPKTAHKVGEFEDRWERGIWLGFIMRSGEHLVGTNRGTFRVSTAMRRSADKRWSAELVDALKGSPAHPVPGAQGRRVPAYAKKFEEETKESAVFIPVSEQEQEVRAAYIYKEDINKHGPTPGCAGCRAVTAGSKYRAKHNIECRKRFEEIISQDEEGKKRLAAANERKLEAISRKCELEEEKRLQQPAAAAPDASTPRGGGGAASSSAIAPETVEAGEPMSIDADENSAVKTPPSRKEKKKMLKNAPAQADDNGASHKEEQKQGQKRKPDDQGDDSERLEREMTEETKGVKRKSEGEPDDASRMLEKRAELTSSMDSVGEGSKHGKDEQEWKDIGSGTFAKTFRKATRLTVTSKGGPPVQDVQRRIVTSLKTGKIIDDCEPDDVPDEALHRRLAEPEDIRIELVMKGAVKLFERKGIDVTEVYSPPRIVQEAGLRPYDGARLTPGWSFDLTRNDPMTGRPWDLCKVEVRRRVRKIIIESKPYLLIGSPPCTMFSSLQNLSKNKRDKHVFDEKMKIAEKHMEFCLELYAIQVRGGGTSSTNIQMVHLHGK